MAEPSVSQANNDVTRDDTVPVGSQGAITYHGGLTELVFERHHVGTVAEAGGVGGSSRAEQAERARLVGATEAPAGGTVLAEQAGVSGTPRMATWSTQRYVAMAWLP